MEPRKGPSRTDDETDDRLEPGTPVEVFSSFNKVWVGRFVVAAAAPGGYRLRRLSDQCVLPVIFGDDAIRPVW
ncbi:MAG TPA: hypothetical protein VHD87_02610 [Acidimicrobiales bacterium]|nr:hypothetical protein [Acidimicrobiales bacterium]